MSPLVKTYVLTIKEHTLKHFYDCHIKFVVNATSENEARSIAQNYSNGDEMYDHDEYDMAQGEKRNFWNDHTKTNCVLMEHVIGIVSAEFVSA